MATHEYSQHEVLAKGIPESHLDSWSRHGCPALVKGGIMREPTRRKGPDGDWIYRSNEIDRILRCPAPDPKWTDESGRVHLDTDAAAEYLGCTRSTVSRCKGADGQNLKPKRVLTYDRSPDGGFQIRRYWAVDDLNKVRKPNGEPSAWVGVRTNKARGI
jgi:hypothetical protein